jgi:hypothetical protein
MRILNREGAVGWAMKCHYCERDAVYAAEKDGIKVGLCEGHFKEQMESLSEDERLASLAERIESERLE